MTKEPKLELDAIEARANAATPGPWTTERPTKTYEGFRCGVTIAATYGRQCIYADPPGGQAPAADQRFIAAARADVPALVAEVRRLRDKLARLDELLAAIFPIDERVGACDLNTAAWIQSVVDVAKRLRASEGKP